jgi:hypothetical protein
VGGEVSELFEPVEAALDDVAIRVDVLVEGRWPATRGIPWRDGGRSGRPVSGW